MKPQTPQNPTPKKQRPPKPNLTIIGQPTGDNIYTFTPLGYFPTKKAAHHAIVEQHQPDLIYLILEDKEAPLYKKMAAYSQPEKRDCMGLLFKKLFAWGCFFGISNKKGAISENLASK